MNLSTAQQTTHSTRLDSNAILEIEVNNHPGVMSHVVGLFSRRAYNVEGILCMPVKNNTPQSPCISRVWLLLKEDQRLDQIVKQVEKLDDVLTVHRHPPEHPIFRQIEPYFYA